MTAQTLTEAVETFLTDAETWLSDADAPAVALLRSQAAALDAEYSAAGANAFGLNYRSLLKRQPAQVVETDPLEALLADQESDDSA